MTSGVGTFVRIGRNVPAVQYAPSEAGPKSRVAVLVMHSDSDYLSFSAGVELSGRGYQVLCANVSDRLRSLDDKILEVGQVVRHLRGNGATRVVLLGHSGGGTLLSAYQNLAEHGPAVFQDPAKLVPAPDRLAGLPPADGLMLVDSNWGNGAMRLFSLDPAVVAEDDGVAADPSLDLLDPVNGFDPAGSHYSAEFTRAFQRAQGDRNNRLISAAMERLEVLEAGRGHYLDDEPLVIPGAEQAFRNNKLYAQDLRLMSRTERAHEIVRIDGSRGEAVVQSMRGPENDTSYTSSYWQGALVTTVRTFLNSYAVRTAADYGFDESTVHGVEWSSSYNCTTGNIVGVEVPLLVMGMTAGWEFAAAEGIHDRATSSDRSLVYIEGADHMLRPSPMIGVRPQGDGDTVKHAYDCIDEWISARPELLG